ncbi:hypothetical protein [Psychromonas antarctica]|nr:hypothetical protein [Psychromonas antarctica]
MTTFQLISTYDAQQRVIKEKIKIADIRDQNTYNSSFGVHF